MLALEALVAHVLAVHQLHFLMRTLAHELL